MTKGCVVFQDVVFYYDAASSPVFDGLCVRFAAGWTGVIGANGAGKTTLLRLACGELTPTRGGIRSPDRVVYCPQRTDDPPAQLASLLDATDGDACTLRGQLGMEADWLTRWGSLSHGECKRAQLGVALWRRPRVLAIDEPTNHIDAEARDLVAGALASFRGIGLLVSHDRVLLDSLCGQCLFVEPPEAVMRRGGYTKAIALAEAEQAEARDARMRARRELKRLKRIAADREREAARSHRKRSKRGLHPKDHDARARIGQARYTGKDGQAGRQLRQLDGRLGQAEENLAGARVKRQQQLGIIMQGAQSRRDALFRIPPGSVALGEQRRLVFPELSMGPADRVALVGPNGGGKSTLVRHIVSRLDLPPRRVVYLAQEIERTRGAEVMVAVRRLPNARLGDVMTVISCLGSNAERLLETVDPSPGELRKVMLALGMVHKPHLIVMDEPTNHLDLPSIECLEAALDACPTGLLLVSHDRRFLKRLTRRRWEVRAGPDDATGVQMRLHIRDVVREPSSEG